MKIHIVFFIYIKHNIYYYNIYYINKNKSNFTLLFIIIYYKRNMKVHIVL